MRFLLLILGLSGAGDGFGAGEGAGGGSWLSSGTAAVFELLARALADNPRSLDDLDRIVERLSRTEAGLAVMPEGFMSLWGTVLDAKRLLRGKA